MHPCILQIIPVDLAQHTYNTGPILSDESVL